MRDQTIEAELFVLSPNRRSDRRADAAMENLTSDARTKIRDHYNASGLIDRVKVMLETVFLHHVAINIKDRGALYAEVRRILKPEGWKERSPCRRPFRRALR